MIKILSDMFCKKYNSTIITISFFVISAVVVLLNTNIASAGEGVVHAFELYVESINLILITVILVLSFKISFRMGGVIRDAVNAVILVLVFFWLKELIAVLNMLGFIALEGAADAIEFFMILTLLMVTNKMRKML
jgi:hypothetical protein